MNEICSRETVSKELDSNFLDMYVFLNVRLNSRSASSSCLNVTYRLGKTCMHLSKAFLQELLENWKDEKVNLSAVVSIKDTLASGNARGLSRKDLA